ncbi:hypothetical protein, partial [Burkholderia pseudomallei]|uniref:hypothetical protein n=1 Tax=Burkholderia pseudomallei TaxID=28450 RepID=UPI001F1E90BC
MSQDGSSGNLTDRLREWTTGLPCRLPRFFGSRIADDNPKQLKANRNIGAGAARGKGADVGGVRMRRKPEAGSKKQEARSKMQDAR